MSPVASNNRSKNKAPTSISNFEVLESRKMMAADTLAAATAPEQTPIHIPVQAEVAPTDDTISAVHDTYGLTGLGQTVVVIDGGVAYDHYALGGGFGAGNRVVGGWDFAENDADPYDDAPRGYHGTHIAGIIGSSDSVHTGLAPEVDIVALRVFDDNAGGDFTWIESALDWVHEHRNDFENPITTVNLSVGTDWNSDRVPAWAQLEAELETLKDDGIFVSVSAGNGFRSSQTVGLSYPAVSPYVVPVGSVNASGDLSAFSQRAQSALMAPGELITSTAPDYLDGFNGIADDFTRSSGTSMAAPYVAGASILVRQAFEIAGAGSVTDITQDMIYDHLRETADEVYDSVTDQTYLRINLEKAIEMSLPADQVGDTLTTGEDLGAVETSRTVAGWMNSTVDTDVFTFVAEEAGTVRVVSESLASGMTVTRVDGGESGGDFTFEVVAGQRYGVQFQAGDLPGQFEARIDFEAAQVADPVSDPVTDPVSDPGNETPADDANAGTDQGGGFEGSENGGGQIADWSGVIQVETTSGSDQIDIYAGTHVEIVVNGELQAVYDGSVTNIEILGATAADMVVIHGTAGDETAVVTEDQATLAGDGWSVAVRGATRLNVDAGGGDDAVTLHDGSGDDLLIGRKDFTILLGAGGRTHRVTGFDHTEVMADAGGRNVAILRDGAGDDLFRFGYDTAEMVYDEGANDTRSINVLAFDRVVGVSEKGGFDRAEAYGSAEANRFVGRENAAYLTGFQESHRAEGFDHVDAYAGENTVNTAWLYDSHGDDQLTISPERIDLRGGYSVSVFNYAEFGALGNAGGMDTAIMRDSAGSDTFISLDGLAILEGDGFRQVVQGYEDVTAISSSGADRAILYGSSNHPTELIENGVVVTVDNATRRHSVAKFGQVDWKGTFAAVEQASEPVEAPLPSDDTPSPLAYVVSQNVIVAAADPGLAIRPVSLSTDRVDQAVGDDVADELPAERVDGRSDVSNDEWDAALQAPVDRSTTAVENIANHDAAAPEDIAAVWGAMQTGFDF